MAVPLLPSGHADGAPRGLPFRSPQRGQTQRAPTLLLQRGAQETHLSSGTRVSSPRLPPLQMCSQLLRHKSIQPAGCLMAGGIPQAQHRSPGHPEPQLPPPPGSAWPRVAAAPHRRPPPGDPPGLTGTRRQPPQHRAPLPRPAPPRAGCSVRKSQSAPGGGVWMRGGRG